MAKIIKYVFVPNIPACLLKGKSVSNRDFKMENDLALWFFLPRQTEKHTC